MGEVALPRAGFRLAESAMGTSPPLRNTSVCSVLLLLRRAHIAEHFEQGEVVDHFQAAADDEGPAERGVAQEKPGDGGTDGGGEAAGTLAQVGVRYSIRETTGRT